MVEHSIGNGEVDSSILSGSTIRLAARPQVASVIAGGPGVEQNVKAIAWNLSAEDMAKIDRITKAWSRANLSIPLALPRMAIPS